MCGSGSWRFVYTAKIVEVTREVFVVSLWNRVATDDVNTSSANAELDSCIPVHLFTLRLAQTLTCVKTRPKSLESP